MHLLEFDDGYNKIVIKPELIHIKVFYKLWRRDQSDNKKRAIQELSYIWHLKAFQSPYVSQGYSQEEITEQFKEDSTLPKDWKPDELVLAAAEKYKELCYTQSMYLLQDAKLGVNKLRRYFTSVDLDEKNDKGTLVHNASTLLKSLKEVGDLNNSLKKLREEVNKEIEIGSKIRGGGEIGIFEDPD